MTSHAPASQAPASNSRRDFLRHSLQISGSGALLLGLAGATATLSGCSRDAATAQGFRVLRAQDLPMLERLLPAALDGTLPVDPAQRATAAKMAVGLFDQLLYDTSPTVRTAFLQIFDLLELGVVRGPVLGLWKSWENASEADGAAVLDRLAGSSAGLLRGIYNGLDTLATMSWYLDPSHQIVTGYPGAPKKIVV